MADTIQPVVPKKRGARVERRGRFTITEFDQESPLSSKEGACDFEEDGEASVVDPVGGLVHKAAEAGVEPTASAAEVTTVTEHSASGSAVFERRPSVSFVYEHNSTGSAVFERQLDPPPPQPTSGLADGKHAFFVDRCTSDASTVTSSMASTSVDSVESVDDPRGAVMTSAPSDRRVKRKGRFTIIELSSTPPHSRRNSEEFEAFSNRSSISVSSTQIAQANTQSASQNAPVTTVCGADGGHGNGSGVISRNPAGTETFQRGRSGSQLFDRQSAPRMVRSTTPDTVESELNGVHHSHLSGSYGSLIMPQQGSSGRMPSREEFGLTTPTTSLGSLSASMTASGVSSAEKRYKEAGAGRRHLASRQKAITISADQFLQQQQTIASLIRQQQELKQLIAILQDQQHQLMSIPLHLSELKLEQAHSDAREESMRETHMQVNALTRANDALQTLLTQAEQDAHERTMEIECLSEENDELRHRCAILERRHVEERKLSFALDQELQQSRMLLHYARQKGDHYQMHPEQQPHMEHQPASENPSA